MKRFLLLFILLIPSVTAVGFMNLPSNREIIFAPEGQVTIPLHVIKGEHITATLSIPPGDPSTLGTPQDDNLAEYVTLVDPAPKTGPRTVQLQFRFPKELRPGTYLVDVYATEYPTNTEGATVSALATTRVRFTVRVLSPDKLLEVTGLSVPPIAEGLDANVTVHIVSRTTERIDSVQAEIRLYKDDELLTSTTVNRVGLASAESAALNAILDTEQLTGGEYKVNATVRYDGKEAYSSQEILKIGTLHVGVPEYTKILTYNTTNRFLLNASNEWNRELQDVYTIVTIGGQTKKSASQNIPPFGKTEYELYFDREESLAVGEQSAKVAVYFKDFDPKSGTYVSKQEEFLLPVQIVLPPATEEPLPITSYIIIMLLAVLLVVALILLIRKPKQPEAAQVPTTPPSAPPQ